MYYRNANCAVVVYDITQPASLEKARTWIRELQRQADPSIVIALCGNKLDLAERRQVTQEEAKKYAEEEGLMWGETSAKSGEGVSDIFVSLGICFPYLLPFVARNEALSYTDTISFPQLRNFPRLRLLRKHVALVLQGVEQVREQLLILTKAMGRAEVKMPAIAKLLETTCALVPLPLSHHSTTTSVTIICRLPRSPVSSVSNILSGTIFLYFSFHL